MSVSAIRPAFCSFQLIHERNRPLFIYFNHREIAVTGKRPVGVLHAGPKAYQTDVRKAILTISSVKGSIEYGKLGLETKFVDLSHFFYRVLSTNYQNWSTRAALPKVKCLRN